MGDCKDVILFRTPDGYWGYPFGQCPPTVFTAKLRELPVELPADMEDYTDAPAAAVVLCDGERGIGIRAGTERAFAQAVLTYGLYFEYTDNGEVLECLVVY